MGIIGRKEELAVLQDCVDSKESELVIVYGRRRVGKTFLVNEFFHNTFHFKFTGLYNMSTDTQLERFSVALEEYSGLSTATPKDWFEAFDQLKKYLKSLTDNRKIVFIDEMPWLDTKSSNFVAALESFWNGWAAAENNIVLIACGSATSWMTNTLINNKGGLFNRASTRIYVKPFTLKETEEYLNSKEIFWTRYDIAECYMIMGGIPFYLKQLKPQFSYTQNIDQLFFKEKGTLWDEFQHLYATLFKQADNHISVVEALAKKKMGLTRNEIIKATGLPDNGNLSSILQNLENNEFIRPYNFFGKKKHDTIYQLSDFYTMFYFTYLKGNHKQEPDFWTQSLDNPSRRAWAGYTFEQVCKGHIKQIKDKIGIGAVQSEVSSWFSKKKDTDQRGAQIDLLIDRRDRVINLCEIKYSINPFSIDKEYEANLRNKIETFRSETGTNKAINLTFITSYGLKRNMYSNRVQTELTLDDLFSE